MFSCLNLNSFKIIYNTFQHFCPFSRITSYTDQFFTISLILSSDFIFTHWIDWLVFFKVRIFLSHEFVANVFSTLQIVTFFVRIYSFVASSGKSENKMDLEFLKTSKCCCGVNLRTGGLIIGFLFLLGSILSAMSGRPWECKYFSMFVRGNLNYFNYTKLDAKISRDPFYLRFESN